MPIERTRDAASLAPSALSSDAMVTLKLAPVYSVGIAGGFDQSNIEAIAGCGTNTQATAPAASTTSTIAAAIVRRLNVSYRVRVSLAAHREFTWRIPGRRIS